MLKKLFKRISWFDGIFISLIMLVGVAFFLFFLRKPEYVTIRVKVTDQDVLYQRIEPKNWYANRFQIGDSELDALGRKITEITGIESFNVDAQSKALYVDLKVRAVYDSRTKLYSARGKSLVFGTPMRINLSTVTFDGFVTEYPNSVFFKEMSEKKVVVNLLARSVEPALASSIKKGDKVFDSNQTLLAEIIDISVSPAERVTQTASGELLLRYDPLYKDVIFKTKLRSKKYQNELYIFDNLPLKVGEIVPLNFSQTSIFPMITSYSELSPSDQ